MEREVDGSSTRAHDSRRSAAQRPSRSIHREVADDLVRLPPKVLQAGLMHPWIRMIVKRDQGAWPSAARPDRFRITPTAVTAATHSKLATMTIAPMSL